MIGLKSGERSIQLVPAGNGLDRQALLDLGEQLRRVFRTQYRIGNAIDPDFAFAAHRGQYHSTAILGRLAALPHGGRTRLLAVTAHDLFVPVLTHVFGEGQVEGHCAIVSLHRLREEFYGLPGRPELLRERLLKEAVHELGHTYGLRHCSDWRCVMASTHAVERLDLKSAEFCGGCWRTAAIDR